MTSDLPERIRRLEEQQEELRSRMGGNMSALLLGVAFQRDPLIESLAELSRRAVIRQTNRTLWISS
jgi:hypothetical protein